VTARAGSRTLAATLAVLATALLANAPALDGEYTFDDHAVVEANPRLAVGSAGDLGRLLASNYWGASGERSGERLFRPTTLATFAVEWTLLGRPSAAASRAANVAFHGLACVLALAFFRRVAGSFKGALLGALVFAAHPLHAECIAGAVGRAEVLAFALGLVALLLHSRARTSWFQAALEGIVFVLALGAKESAIAVIPIALLVDVLTPHPTPPPQAGEGGSRLLRMRGYVGLGLGFLVYLGFRVWALGDLLPHASAHTLGDMGLAGRSLYALAVLRDAWVATVFSWPGTSAHYPLPLVSAPWLALALLVQVSVLGAAWTLAWRGPVARGVAIGLVAFELALLPVSNLIAIGVVFAERLLYAATAWGSLAAGAALGPHVRGPRARLLAALVVGTLAALEARNDRTWANDLALWKASATRFPDEPRAQLALGESFLMAGKAGDALLPLDFAATHFPDGQPLKPKAYMRLAQAIRAANPRDRARSEAAFASAVRLGPDRADVWVAIARARLEDLDRPDSGEQALRAAREACRLAPELYEAHVTLGVALHATGDDEAAVAELTAATKLSADPVDAFFYRAEALTKLGRTDEAREDDRRSRRPHR
jgi:tetratricopeptide (TPR) repeat protein